MKKMIPFLQFRFATLGLSLAAMVGLFALTFIRGGFNVGIDFKPGLSLTVVLPENTQTAMVKQTLASLSGVVVQKSENSHFVIRVATDNSADFRERTEQQVTQLLSTKFESSSVVSAQFVGSNFSRAIFRNTLILVLGALLVIAAYLIVRFEWPYAVSAIIATLHDVLFVIAFIGAAQLEIDSATVAAILTIIGYSLNDTIVIFDRIRENRFIEKTLNLHQIIDLSVTQTLSRTIITSMTTLISILPLIFLATGSVKLFALEMAMGILVGTYSSIFIASVSLNAIYKARAKRKATAQTV